MRVIDQPRISGKFRESDYYSEKKKSPQHWVTPDKRKADEQTMFNKIERRARAPV